MVPLDNLIPKLHGFLAQRVANPADRKDLAQDILLRIHRCPPELADDPRTSAWISQVARNVLVDHYCRRHRPPLTLEAPPPPDVREIVTDWLAPMVGRLPDPYREAVRLSDLEGVPRAAVAARLSISLSAANSRIQRGRSGSPPPPDVHEIVTDWLAPMVDQLPYPYREAVRLSDLEGVPRAAVAARLSISLSAANSRIQRGRAKLRAALTGCCEFESGANGRLVSFEPFTANRGPFC